MLVLGIDTATRIASIGVCDTGHTLAVRALPVAGSHARTLLAHLETVLQIARLRLADLDLLAVSIGPGSFTGLRIGLSTAKGLALAARLPVVGVPTLDAYARTAGPRDGTVWPVLDARKGEVYAAGYRWRDGVLTCIHPQLALTPAALAARIDTPCTLLGDGVDAYEELWERSLGAAAARIGLDALPPNGAVVALLGSEQVARGGPDDVHSIEPLYCRLPEAQAGRGQRTQPSGRASVTKLTGNGA